MIKNFSQNKAFTLIELLLVISIIALLSSIVMSSVQDARNKARLQATLSQMIEIQKDAELYFLNNNSYTEDTSGQSFSSSQNDVCKDVDIYSFLNIGVGADSKIDNLVNNHSMVGQGDVISCGVGNNGKNYFLAVSTPVRTIEHNFYDPVNDQYFTGTVNTICIDSTGFSGYVNKGMDEFGVEEMNYVCDRREP